MGKGIRWSRTIEFQTIRGNKKKCRRCKIWRTLKNFRKSRKSFTRFLSTCSLCFQASRIYSGRELKKEFIKAYGGKCACCGIEEIDLLTVEHKNGGGSLHRKVLYNEGKLDGWDRGRGMILWLKNNNWPKRDFSVLCWNCNCARRWNRPCPHDVKKYNRWLSSIVKLARLR